ncbi:MAG: hypothetical protein QW303_02180 [Nitrososphaerota archaeon]
MELALLLGVGLTGYYLNKFDNYQTTKLLKDEKKSSNGQNNRNYSGRNSKKTLTSRSMNKNDLLDVSENLADNSSSIKKILDHNNPEKLETFSDSNFNVKESLQSKQSFPEYLSQFDVQTFDSFGDPSAPNDIYQTSDKAKLTDLERKISYQERWSPYGRGTMSYGIFPDNQLTHHNMVPFYNTKHGYGSNELHNEHLMNYKNELFSGNLKSTWRRKMEVGPLFEPTAELYYPNGTPVRSDEETSRYIPSRYFQKEKPFEEVRVTPGLNLNYDEIGTHGYHSLYRIPIKTVDELRVKPKITYEGRVVPGMKGEKRPIQAPVFTYKPDTFKITSEIDLLPNSDLVDGPYIRNHFIMKETDRSGQHIEYTGGAYTNESAVGKNVPECMREKCKYSTKQNFVLPKPLQKFSRDGTIFNPNVESYDLPFNFRSQTTENEHIGNANIGSETNIYVEPMDVVRITSKELFADQPFLCRQVRTNTMRGTVHSFDVVNPTIKEIAVENRLNPNVNLDSKQRVYHSDSAKNTLRETYSEQVTPIDGDNRTYANWMDQTKNTVRETTIQIPYQSMVTPINQNQGSQKPQDIPRDSLKETTTQIPRQTFIIPPNRQLVVGLQDIPRSTNRETTSFPSCQGTITPKNHQWGSLHPQDQIKTTTKETIDIPYQSILSAKERKDRSRPQDQIKTTTRETTVQIPCPLFILTSDQHPRMPLQDPTKNTMKETAVIPSRTNITMDDRGNKPHPQDYAKTTIKESTVQIPYQIQTVTSNHFQGKSGSFDRSPPRTTTNEQTITIPYNQILGSHGKLIVHPQGLARETTRESTIQIPYNTVITSSPGQPVRLQDVAKITSKETMLELPPNMIATGSQQGKSGSFNHLPTKETMKETTVDLKHIGTPAGDVSSHGHGYLSQNMYLPNTNKQFTCQEVYITPLEGNNKNRPYMDALNAQMSNRKELLQQYRPPTNSNINVGPDPNMMNVRQKDDENNLEFLMPVYSTNYHSEKPVTITTSRKQDKFRNEKCFSNNINLPEIRFIDPVMLEQLKNNRYHIPLFIE